MKAEKENVSHWEGKQPFVIVRNQRKNSRQDRPVLQSITRVEEEDISMEELLPRPLSYGCLGWEPAFAERDLLVNGCATRQVPTPGPETLINYWEFD